MRPQHWEWRLTGRARVRPGWFGRQILQVEVRELAYSACPPRPGSDPVAWRELMRRQGTESSSWRDATFVDVQMHGLILKNWGHEPPRALPPSPPPMADMTYGCHEHYYDGCPNCGRGKNKE